MSGRDTGGRGRDDTSMLVPAQADPQADHDTVLPPATLRSPDFDASGFRRALGRFPTGVAIITARTPQGQALGMTISSFNSVSLDPPLVLWSLAKRSAALAIFEQVDRYAIHILAAGQAGLARQFAKPAAQGDRFAGVPWALNEFGVPRLKDECAAWFECHNRSRYPEGDHVILVGTVERCGQSERLPLVFHAGGFHLTPDEDIPTP